MEEILKESAKSVPNLIALGGIVLIFLRYLAKRDDALGAIIKENTDSNKEVIRVLSEFRNPSNCPVNKK